jgi:hypothetical protein
VGTLTIDKNTIIRRNNENEFNTQLISIFGNFIYFFNWVSGNDNVINVKDYSKMHKIETSTLYNELIYIELAKTSICICGLFFDVRTDYWIKKLEGIIKVIKIKELNEV